MSQKTISFPPLVPPVLSPTAAEKEQHARAIAQQCAPELCGSLGDIISYIPHQGQSFGGVNEWKPWCRLVEELNMIAENEEAARELHILQLRRKEYRSAYINNNMEQSNNFFTFFPLVTYILALLYPRARTQMLLVDYIVPFVDSGALPSKHPARIPLKRSDLHMLLPYVQSQEATKALFALCGVSSLLDIVDSSRHGIIESSLCSAFTSFEHKREMIRLVYDAYLHNDFTYITATNTNLVTHFLDRVKIRERNETEAYTAEGRAISCDKLMRNIIFDERCDYNVELANIVADEIVRDPETIPHGTFVMLFPLDRLTAEKWTNCVEPFLRKTTDILLSQEKLYFINIVNRIEVFHPSLLKSYITTVFLPLYVADHPKLCGVTGGTLGAIGLQYLAEQLNKEQITALLAAVLEAVPHRKDIMSIVPHLVNLGAELAAVDVPIRTNFSQDFLRYFLRERPIVSSNALCCAVFSLKAKEYMHYLSAPTLTIREKQRIADHAYRAVKVRVILAIENDIGGLPRYGTVYASYLTPRRLVRLVEYLGDRVQTMWSPLPQYRPLLKKKLEMHLNNPIAAEAARKVISFYPD